mmetsp:Transcript_24576/g.40217  ORF Transcript_24576/g.40217 Transcript_24576/m.40217 type:complete len:86 (-) Transcript_24576:80-337(-)
MILGYWGPYQKPTIPTVDPESHAQLATGPDLLIAHQPLSSAFPYYCPVLLCSLDKSDEGSNEASDAGTDPFDTNHRLSFFRQCRE